MLDSCPHDVWRVGTTEMEVETHLERSNIKAAIERLLTAKKINRLKKEWYT
jgi:hypothetical protein